MTNFLRFSGLLIMSCRGWGSLVNGSLRKSNWNTCPSKRLRLLVEISSCITFTSCGSSVEAQMLYLLVSPASRFPVPAAQSHT